MIVVELIESGTCERRYSNKNVMLRQIETGNLYEDVADYIPCSFTYEETDIPIPEEPATVEDKAEAYDILMGVSE